MASSCRSSFALALSLLIAEERAGSPSSLYIACMAPMALSYSSRVIYPFGSLYVSEM